jgi:U4/U6.U5 tri-snRNP component SNU23
MGFSMKTERSTLEQVKSIFKNAKRKKEEEEQYNFDERMQKLKEDEERRKQEKKDRKKQKKQKTEEAEPSTDFGGDDVDVLAAMGLPTGFGGKSK